MTNGLGKISRFDLREKIAESSFAVVYKAFDPETSALVAVKLCVATDAALRERFLRAAQAAASLSHPHIARILEFGSGGDRPYLVEEFLAGTDLREYLKHRRLGAGTNEIRMLVQIARALQYAHRRGVPHLDLKPATVHLEGGQDEIKLVDFGIARLASAALSLGSPGTLPPAGGYLAPEQALGLPPDERTDVYCFGALAYQILTGRPPFEGKTLAEVARKTLEEDPVPVGSSWGDCPAELEVMVERCLSKSPGDRYGSFDDVLLDLVPTLEALRTNSTGEFLRVVEETRPGDETSFTQQAVSLDDTVEVPVPIEEVPAEPEDDDTLEDRLVTAIFTPEVPPSLASTPRPAATESPVRAAAAPAATAMAPPVPTPAAPAAVPAKAAPRPPAGAKKKRWVAVLAAIAAFLMLALGVVWLARGLSREQPPRPSLAPAPKLVTSSPSAASATGRLVIDAVPWGEVVALRDASGRSQALPSERRTPLILALPPGQYVAEVSNPGASTPGRCMTEVVDGKESLCTVQVLSLKAEDYFDVAGWWR